MQNQEIIPTVKDPYSKVENNYLSKSCISAPKLVLFVFLLSFPPVT